MAGELETVRQAQFGDEEAFTVLVRKYEKQIFRHVLRMVRKVEDAEDLTQEVFLRAYQWLGSYNGEASFGRWLHRIATNVCIDKLRKRRIPTVPWPEWNDGEEQKAVEFPSGDPGPEEIFEEQESLGEILAAAGRLPGHYREAFLLKNISDRSYEEIAGFLGCPEGTVKSRVSRAHGMLRKELTLVALRNTGALPSNMLGREMAVSWGSGD